MFDIPVLIQQCAPTVSPVLMQALVRQESAFNPYAIGVDAGTKPADRPVAQPQSLQEAVAMAEGLLKRKVTFSVGLAQIHVSNVNKLNLTWQQAFDPCQNLAQGQSILWHFWRKAIAEGYRQENAVFAALRGYNSGSVHTPVSNAYAKSIFRFMSEPVPVEVTLKNMAGKRPPSDPAQQIAVVEAALPPEPGTQEVFDKPDNQQEGF